MNDSIKHHLLRHEQVLENLVLKAEIPARRIKEAMHYALFPGGKRLRPMLVYLCGDLLNVPAASLDIIAASLEITHCYSLIHDDLPAMDNDDYRRGRLSCHRAFDEATAILVGDGMQALAIDILITHLPKTVSLSQTIHITQELIKASGCAGMVSGQSLDLSELTNPSTTNEQLRTIHTLKTGRLIQACINMVLLAVAPPDAYSVALQTFATHLGLVFQMQDDYLDQYASSSVLGKDRASDSANHKITFASLYTKESLATLVQNHYQKAAAQLSIFSDRAHPLLCLIETLQQRMNNV